MRLLVVDVESSGYSHASDHLLEVAAVTYCTASRTVLAGVHFLIPTVERNKAEHVNHISATALRQRPVPGMKDAFVRMYSDADTILAHNKQFDEKWITAHWPDLPRKQWVCTVKDLNYPKSKGASCRRLSHLAVDHGINPVDAHRAMGDVMTLVRLLALVPDLEAQIGKATRGPVTAGEVPSPTTPSGPLVLHEIVSSSYDRREEYKAAGFRWDGEAKRWQKKVPRAAASDGSYPFALQPVQAPSFFKPQAAKVPAPKPAAPAPSVASESQFADPMDEPAVRDDDDDDSWDL
jgi:DNA polymerase III subunit epsilon